MLLISLDLKKKREKNLFDSWNQKKGEKKKKIFHIIGKKGV